MHHDHATARRLENRSEEHDSIRDDDNAQVKLQATRAGLRVQDFYGLGPFNTLAGHAVYRQQEDSLGADAYTPVTSWAGVNAALHYLNPAIKNVTGDVLPSVPLVYGEAGAPASTTRPDFVQFGIGGSLRTPTFKSKLPWERHNAKVLYEHFSEVGSARYSFGRLSASAAASASLKKKLAFNYNRP